MSDIQAKLQDWFNTPNGRRVSILLLLVVLAMVIVMLMPASDPSSLNQTVQKKASKDFLTGDGANDLNVQTLTVRDQKMTKKLEELQDMLLAERSKSEAEKKSLEHELRKNRDEVAAVRRERAQIYDEVKERFRVDMEQQQAALQDLITNQLGDLPVNSGAGGASDDFDNNQSSSEVPFLPPIEDQGMPLSVGATADLRGSDSVSPNIALTIVGDEEDEEEKSVKEQDLVLPAGSILTGVLVSGMDASTSGTTKREPYPALVRVKLDAILPNRFSMDLRECHLVVSGFGDISSERAYIRTEKISCIREDGAVLESSIEAWATGEDGKAGLRGTVVTRNGPLLLRGLFAGFASGIADATKPQAIQGIQTSPGTESVFQTPATTDVLKSGSYGGVSSAMDSLAEYYIKMAEEFYPVVEIGAGREVNFIISSGIRLNFNNTIRG